MQGKTDGIADLYAVAITVVCDEIYQKESELYICGVDKRASFPSTTTRGPATVLKTDILREDKCHMGSHSQPRVERNHCEEEVPCGTIGGQWSSGEVIASPA